MSCPDKETSDVIGESVARSITIVTTTSNRCCSAVALRDYASRVHKKTASLCQRLHTLFTAYPHEHHTTYTKHAVQALRKAILLGKGAIGLCIHSVFPFLCQKTGTDTVDQLYEEIHPKKKELK